MAIKFNCDCGQTITARDEYAGRKVQCVGCKKVHVVPGQKRSAAPAAPPPRPVPPPEPDLVETMMMEPARTAAPEQAEPAFAYEDAPAREAMPVEEAEARFPTSPSRPAAAAARTDVLRFRCACGAEYHAQPEFAGEPTRCMRCGEVLFIPSRQTAARTGGRPVKVGFDRDDRYKPKREAGSGLLTFLAVLLLLGMMGGGAFAYWQFYLKDFKANEPKTPRAGGPPPGGGMPGGEGMPGGGFPPGGGFGPGGGRPGGAGGGQERPPTPEKPVIVRDGENAQAQALDLVPADGLGFLSTRMADVYGDPDTIKLLGKLPKEQRDAMQASEQAIGLKNADIERVIGVFPDANIENAYALVELSKAFDREKLLTALTVSKPAYQENGDVKRAYYLAGPTGAVALHFANDKLLIASSKAGMLRFLKQTEIKKTGALESSLKLAAGKDLMVGAAVPPAGLLEGLAALAPPSLAAYKPLLAFKKFTLLSKEKEPWKTTLEFECADAPAAETLRKTVEDLKVEAVKQLAALGLPKEATDSLAVLLNNVKATKAEAAARIEFTGNVETIEKLLSVLLPSVQKVRQSADRFTSQNNLKQLALAMIAYADAHNGQLPPQAVVDKDGNPLYSWRVLLLPYLEENKLFQQLKRDEPWNSKTNQSLLANMPKVFRTPEVNGPGLTAYQVFSGEETPFPTGQKSIRWPIGFRDGTSNTLLIVEGAMPVHWASPGDIFVAPEVNLRARLGKRTNGGTAAVFADGATRILPANITEKLLRALVTPAGDEVVELP